jgi:DNA-binding transcriptional MerR regulator
MSNELLTTGQVAAILGVHRTTVHHWEKAGKLTPFTVANGVRLFTSADIAALANERGAK